MDKIDIRDLIIRTLKENSEEINNVEIVEQTAFLRISEAIVKNLSIPNVSQQRELFLDLLRFNEEYFEKSNCEWLSEEVLDEWLKSKNCC